MNHKFRILKIKSQTWKITMKKSISKLIVSKFCMVFLIVMLITPVKRAIPLWVVRKLILWKRRKMWQKTNLLPRPFTRCNWTDFCIIKPAMHNKSRSRMSRVSARRSRQGHRRSLKMELLAMRHSSSRAQAWCETPWTSRRSRRIRTAKFWIWSTKGNDAMILQWVTTYS